MVSNQISFFHSIFHLLVLTTVLGIRQAVVDQMMFYINVVNTKVVYNFIILFVLKFHDFRPAGLGVIDFRSLLSGFAGPLNRSE